MARISVQVKSACTTEKQAIKKTATAKSLRQCISAISIRNAQIVYFLKRLSYTVYEDKNSNPF